MTINKNKVVSVNYHLTGKEEGGEEQLIEQTSIEKPFVFLYGVGGLIEDFEKNMKGKKRINNTGKKLFMYQRYFSLL